MTAKKNISGNVDYSLRSRRFQKLIDPVVADFHRKRKARLQAEYQAQQGDESRLPRLLKDNPGDGSSLCENSLKAEEQEGGVE